MTSRHLFHTPPGFTAPTHCEFDTPLGAVILPLNDGLDRKGRRQFVRDAEHQYARMGRALSQNDPTEIAHTWRNGLTSVSFHLWSPLPGQLILTGAFDCAKAFLASGLSFDAETCYRVGVYTVMTTPLGLAVVLFSGATSSEVADHFADMGAFLLDQGADPEKSLAIERNDGALVKQSIAERIATSGFSEYLIAQRENSEIAGLLGLRANIDPATDGAAPGKILRI